MMKRIEENANTYFVKEWEIGFHDPNFGILNYDYSKDKKNLYINLIQKYKFSITLGFQYKLSC